MSRIGHCADGYHAYCGGAKTDRGDGSRVLCGCECHGDSCAECGTFTNHTTAQHDEAMRPRCSMCGELTGHDDEERTRCDECQAEYWEMRQELYYDNLAKEEGGQG